MYSKFRFGLIVLNATFNNITVISLKSALLVEETGVRGENHWPVARHWQTLSHNVVSNTPRHDRGSWSGFELTMLVLIDTNCTCICKSDYHAITTTTTPTASLITYQYFCIAKCIFFVYFQSLQDYNRFNIGYPNN